jgi:hypothetical protein
MSQGILGLSNLPGGLGPLGNPLGPRGTLSTELEGPEAEAPIRMAGSFPSDLRLAAALKQGALLSGALAESPLLGPADGLLNQLMATVADR